MPDETILTGTRETFMSYLLDLRFSLVYDYGENA